MEVVSNDNEQKAAVAFSRQSKIFDELFSSDTIIQYKRERVRNHFLHYLQPASFILELNSGTGEDAVYFARQGHLVNATDIAEGMQKICKEKIEKNNFQNIISTELCSFIDLDSLKNKGPYDAIFSNFAGLNCTDELGKVLCSFNHLLKPGGIVTLVVMPKFYLWETLLLFKGKFKTATRRFFSSEGRNAHIEGAFFKCWYYNPSYIIKNLKQHFELLSLEGLCTIVPPSYMSAFAERHPSFYKIVKAKENKYKSKWPWKYIGDYYIISFRKR